MEENDYLGPDNSLNDEECERERQGGIIWFILLYVIFLITAAVLIFT